MKTRDKILHKSLELFNKLGEPNVTTLLISDELDISPGNLYYHFKSKTDILTEIFGWYEREMNQLLEAPSTVTDIEDQWFFLHLIFENIAKYRFIYKDVVNVLERYEEVKLRFQKIILKKREASLKILTNLHQQGILKANESELEALCEHIVLTATFWLNYKLISRGKLTEDVLAHGVYQVISIVAPFLDDAQRDQLNELKAQYL
ncbi:MAG: AcrR family transcriptional regulator [Oleiphilaceae bacterium]|jgi:AcrR family transcriptional regulator